MLIVAQNPYTNHTQFFDEKTMPTLPVGTYALGIDQSTTYTGITVGDLVGNIAIILLFVRNDDMSAVDYKAQFKELYKRLIKGSTLPIIGQEDRFSKGYYETDEMLSMMKYTFYEAKTEADLSYEIEMIPQQVWKSNFILTEDRTLSKKNVTTTVRHYFPNFYAYRNDMDDSVGIYHYLVTKVIPSLFSKNGVFKVYKGLPKNNRHELYMRVVAEYEKGYIDYNEYEEAKIEQFGLREFEYLDKMWIEDVCRYLTSNSNAVWIAEIPEYNQFIDAIWYKWDIIPSDKKLYVITFRKNFVRDAKLDKR